jgi:hypothetical protein
MSQLLFTTNDRPVLSSTGAKVGSPLVCTRMAGVVDTRIVGGSAFNPGTSAIRFCSARLAATRASETVTGPVGRILPTPIDSAARSSRDMPEKFRSVTVISLMTMSS